MRYVARLLPWMAIAALAGAWWPGSLERYATARAYMEFHGVVREAAFLAGELSQEATAEDAAALRARLQGLMHRLRPDGNSPLGLLRRADRLYARQWQEWEETLWLTGAVLAAAGGSGPGPLPAPAGEEAAWRQGLAAELRELAGVVDVGSWEPPDGPALYQRRLGSYLTAGRRAQIQERMAVIAARLHERAR